MGRASRVERIVEGAAALFHERGYHGVSMRQVASAAGTSLANLYHYVGGKEDLAYQVARRVLEAAVTSGEAALAARGGRAGLEALVTDHVRRVLARPYEADLLRGAGAPLSGDRARRVEEARRRYHALVRASVEDALRGVPRPRTADLWTTLLIGMADRAALDALRRLGNASPDRLAGAALAVFFDGVLGRTRTRRT